MIGPVKDYGRLVAYWATIAMVLMFSIYMFSNPFRTATKWLYESGLLTELSIREWFGGYLLLMLAPPAFVGMIGYLLIVRTSHLPIDRLSWIYRPTQALLKCFFVMLRSHESSLPPHVQNQWGVGDHSFYAVFVVFVFIPTFFYLVGAVYQDIIKVPYWLVEEDEPVPPGYDLYLLSLYFGLAGSLAMSFFLIPVSRHNILLAAVGWSPFHAIKLHILSGSYAYILILLHGLTHVIYIFKGYGDDGHKSVIDQIIPDAKCWVWKPDPGLYESCTTQWWSFTGFISFFFLTGLAVTSLHWFRRRHYNIFYKVHIVCSFFGIMFGIMHNNYLAIFIFPSLLYYFASLSPVLIQALASYFRGGVKITQVVAVKDSGGCVEVHIAASPLSSASMDSEVCLVVKVCVPSISLVWHPFTVYKHVEDNGIVRFLMRPIGPFTKAMATHLVKSPRPVMVLDGLYRGGDRVLEAMCHDVVSIVCGGVALTPFLSMIPTLIKTIGFQKIGITKKVVLHWACREEGLITFITQHYLQEFEKLSRKVKNGLVFDIVVYHTSPKNAACVESDSCIEEDVTVFDDHVETVRVDHVEKDGSEDTPCENMTSDEQDDMLTLGHTMEPARFMPALYLGVLGNLSQFFMMGSLLMIGLVLYIHYYNKKDIYETAEVLLWVVATQATLVWIAVSLGFAIVGEMIFRAFSSSLSAQHDIYPVSEYDPEETTGDKLAGDAVDADEMPTVVQHRHARPTAANIFAGLENASCPGFFMCGPSGLVNVVRHEASLENSNFGFTRYALYEEPFNM